jgi:hypothetical protein
MASVANNGAYGNQAWGSGPQPGPGPGPAWGNQGWQPQSGWSAPPFWQPTGISKPMGIFFTVLGFAFWWPVGLAMLLYMVCSGRGGCRGWGRAWQSAAPQNGGCSWTPPWKAWRSTSAPPSSGNRAFDDYRADTLKRLEDEQQEFAAFLERLRFAKDKAEFDQFMSERRQRPAAPPSAGPDQDPA